MKTLSIVRITKIATVLQTLPGNNVVGENRGSLLSVLNRCIILARN